MLRLPHADAHSKLLRKRVGALHAIITTSIVNIDKQETLAAQIWNLQREMVEVGAGAAERCTDAIDIILQQVGDAAHTIRAHIAPQALKACLKAHDDAADMHAAIEKQLRAWAQLYARSAQVPQEEMMEQFAEARFLSTVRVAQAPTLADFGRYNYVVDRLLNTTVTLLQAESASREDHACKWTPCDELCLCVRVPMIDQEGQPALWPFMRGMNANLTSSLSNAEFATLGCCEMAAVDGYFHVCVNRGLLFPDATFHVDLEYRGYRDGGAAFVFNELHFSFGKAGTPDLAKKLCHLGTL